MEKMIKDIVVRDCTTGGYDMVLRVKNLPREYVYQETPKMVDRVDRDGYKDGTQAVDPLGTKGWTTLPGVSFNEDTNTFLFQDTAEGRDAIAGVNRYIDAKLPREMKRPEYVLFTSQRGNFAAQPIPFSKIPICELPDLEIKAVPPPVSPPTKVEQERPAVLSDSQINVLRERAAKARAAKAAKRVALQNQ
jgi:hypothetical protein